MGPVSLWMSTRYLHFCMSETDLIIFTFSSLWIPCLPWYHWKPPSQAKHLANSLDFCLSQYPCPVHQPLLSHLRSEQLSRLSPVFLTQHGKRPIICGLDLYSSLQIGMPSLLSPSCQFSASRPETSVESIRWITALPGLKSFVGGSLTALTTKYPKPGALPLPTPAR